MIGQGRIHVRRWVAMRHLRPMQLIKQDIAVGLIVCVAVSCSVLQQKMTRHAQLGRRRCGLSGMV